MDKTTEIGQKLLHYAEKKDHFSAQRKLAGELFPYIWVASKRMSLRAISRWLKDSMGVSLSVKTISLAMKNERKHWLALVDRLEPSARGFRAAYEFRSWEIVLKLTPEVFLSYKNQTPPVLVGENKNKVYFTKEDIDAAANFLWEKWFSLPEEARDICLLHLAKSRQEEGRPQEEEVLLR